MSQSQTDKLVYSYGKEYLLGLEINGLTPKLLNKYLHPDKTISKPGRLNEIYLLMLESAQNANMKAGVIGGAIGGVDKLSNILFSFDPVKIVKIYKGRQEQLLNTIEETLKPRGKIRRSQRSIWPRYCQTIISSAEFLMQFSEANDFYTWVDFFYNDIRSRPALPMLLGKEISGFGFALACDFLKELGYVDFGKPDVHIKDIFFELGLCPKESDDYQVFKAIVRVAKNANVTPYNADKLFWLIGSGYFYNDNHWEKWQNRQ